MARANWKSLGDIARQRGAVVFAGLRRIAVEDVLRRHVVTGLARLAARGRDAGRPVAGGGVQRVVVGEALGVIAARDQ